LKEPTRLAYCHTRWSADPWSGNANAVIKDIGAVVRPDANPQTDQFRLI
jgi:hypothetical protein